MERVKVGIIGPGNIGTDLMYKVMRSRNLEMKTMTGIVESEGIRRLRAWGFRPPSKALRQWRGTPEIGIVFDATGAAAHMKHAPILREAGKIVFDMTPAAVGPFVVPCVNLDHLQELNTDNYNMVTCGGQATIPIAYAINRAADSEYTEIVACISSKSAGPGTRANIDEFTQTTSKALHVVGGADPLQGHYRPEPGGAAPDDVQHDLLHCEKPGRKGHCGVGQPDRQGGTGLCARLFSARTAHCRWQ